MPVRTSALSQWRVQERSQHKLPLQPSQILCHRSMLSKTYYIVAKTAQVSTSSQTPCPRVILLLVGIFPNTHAHTLQSCVVTPLTADSSASIAAIAIVACSNASVATEVT